MPLLLRRLGHEAAAIEKRPLFLLGRLALGLQFFGRGVVAIGQAGRQQFRHGRLILRQPLRLIIRRMRAADFGAFVPIDPQPAEAVQDRGQRRLDIPLLIGVVDPQQELPAMPPGKQPTEQRRAHAADVQISGRTGSKTGADHNRSIHQQECRRPNWPALR